MCQHRQYGAKVYALHRLHNGIEKSFSSAINAVVVVVVVIALLIVLSVFSFCSFSVCALCFVIFFLLALLCSSLLYFRVYYCHIYTCTKCLYMCSESMKDLVRTEHQIQIFSVKEQDRERERERDRWCMCECAILIQLSRIYVNDFRTKLYQHNL